MSGLLTVPPEVYALALVSAVLWGFSPILSKRGMAAGGHAVQAALTVVVVDFTLYWVALAVRQGTDVFAGLSLPLLGLFAVAGVVGTAFGRIGVFDGVDRVGASVNSAVVSSRPLFTALLAVVALGEPLELTTAAGVVVLVVGLALLALSKGGDISGWDPSDLAVPVVTAVFFAAGNVLRRFGLQASPINALEAVAINDTAALAVLGAYALIRGGEDVLHFPRRSYLYFAGSGALTAVALVSLFSALSNPAGRVAIVDSLASTAPLFTAVFAYFLLGDLERVTRGIVAGALLVVAGVALVTLGPSL